MVVLRRAPLIRLEPLEGAPVQANGAYWGAAPAWRPRLDDGRLDLKYLPASRRLARTRAVLSILAGLIEVDGPHEIRLARELRVESRDGPVEFARAGEPDGPATTFQFTKLPGHLVIYRPSTG